MVVWPAIQRAAGAAWQGLSRKMLNDKRELQEDLPTISEQVNLNVLRANDPEVQRIAPKLVQQRGFGIAKQDLVPVQGAMVNPHPWHRLIIRKMKKYLEPRAVSALVGAYALIRIEDGANSRRHLAYVRVQRDKFFSRDQAFRKRVYNVCRSDFMKEFLYEMVADLELEKPRIEVAELAQRAFGESINAHPINIYVSQEMPQEEVIEHVKAKILAERRPLIRVYARGRKWGECKSFLPELAAALGLGCHHEERPIGRTPSGCTRLWQPDEGVESWMELERQVEATLRNDWQDD